MPKQKIYKMKNEIVYFFKQNGANPIRITRISSYNFTLECSKLKNTSHLGGEIIGYINCNNAMEIEKELHLKFRNYHVIKDWYDISIEQVKLVINEHKINRDELFIEINNYLNNGGNEQLIYNIINSFKINNKDVNSLENIISNLDSNFINSLHIRVLYEKVCFIDESFKDLSINQFSKKMAEIGYKTKLKNVKGRVFRIYTPA